VRLAATPTSVAAGTVVGTSSLAEWDLVNERVHLGWTAYGPQVVGEPVNPACKLALLAYAFDDCGFGRVKLQTDLINTGRRPRSPSSARPARACCAGTSAGPTARGATRCVFSILVDEWPSVRDGLLGGSGSAYPAVMSELTAPDPAVGARAYELDRAHVFHSWSAQALITPMVVAGAQGSYIWDYDGNRYLDFSSQLVNVNIGHQHPKVVAAIQEQAARLCTIAPQHANDQRSEAARLIVERAPDGLDKVFFTNGGADAIENAVRMARLHTGRHKVLTTYRSYHGNTATAIQMTGDPRRWANDGGATGVVHFFGPYPYRSPFWSESPEQECARALEHLEQVVAFEGPGTFAALVLETIPGTAGILIPPDGYLAGVREICDRYGIVYIADEVMAGFGRAGEWFAVDKWDVTPDLITFAKGSNSGYVPLGGVIISTEIADTFAERVFPGGLTYSGHPLACAAVVASITAMAEEGIIDNARASVRTCSARGCARSPSGTRRSARSAAGCVLGARPGQGQEHPRDAGALQRHRRGNAPMAALVGACKSRGMLPFANFNRLHVVPPCTTDRCGGQGGPGDPRRGAVGGGTSTPPG
jgi:taurine--2-oxoglutarate transaminase